MTTISLSEFTLSPPLIVATSEYSQLARLALAGTGHSADAADDLCGHRNMSGRTCTRERGHAAKSHRYS